MPKLIRITTVPLSLHVLLRGQMKYMREQGWDVTMVSADGKELPGVLEFEGCKHAIVPMTRSITPFKDIVSLYRLIRLFRRIRPDIVHSHTPKAGLLAMLAAKLAGVKVRVHTVAGLRFMTATGFTRKLLVGMEKLTSFAATHVWPNSFSLLDYIKQHRLAPEKKLSVIGLGSSNGVNLDRYSVSSLIPEKLEKIKAHIRYDSSLRYFICVGRIVKDKGIDELVKAFSRVWEKYPETRLVLVGDYEDELDPVSDEARTLLQTHPGIIMAGWSDEVEYYMHLAFALLHPSYREGFPNVLLQAGAMGCPVICSRIEGNIDIVEDEKTGLIVDVRNADDLCQHMQYALENPGLLRDYAAALRQKIEQYYNQPVVCRLLHERYLTLLPSPAH